MFTRFCFGSWGWLDGRQSLVVLGFLIFRILHGDLSRNLGGDCWCLRGLGLVLGLTQGLSPGLGYVASSGWIPCCGIPRLERRETWGTRPQTYWRKREIADLLSSS
jgi:hypothetical protein